MNIRAATNADSPVIQTLIFSVLREYGLTPEPDGADQDLNQIEEMYFARGGYFGVVEENNVIVATLALYPMGNQSCELRKMYCAKSSRGKGLGKQMMHFALAKAKELGFSHISLETATQLKEAIALYKKFGFTELKGCNHVTRCDQAFELNLH